MKLSVSNIGWDHKDEDKIISELKKQGFEGIEIAPTKIWAAPTLTNHSDAIKYSKLIKSHGLHISSLQSLLYGQNDLQIFGDEVVTVKTFQYLANIISLAHKLGTHTLVFGSPKNRIKGILTTEQAYKIIGKFLNPLLKICEEYDIYICIEANAKEYGADFITTVPEAIELITTINHPNLRLNLDLGNMIMSGEDVQNSTKLGLPYAHHIQISEPYLKPLGKYIKYHELFSAEIKKYDYHNWISLEMLTDANDKNNSSLKTSMQLVKKYYDK